MMNSCTLFFIVTGKKAPRRAPRPWSPRKPPKAWKYRAWVRTLPSAVSGRQDYINGKLCCEAAHTGSDGGMRMKSSGYSCVPLTIEEHREYHQIGRDGMEAKYGVSFKAVVRELNRAWFIRRAA